MRISDWSSDVCSSDLFLTRIPVFSIEYSGHSTLAGACWAFPLVGAFVGLVGTVVLWLADGFGLASQLAAVLAIAAMTALTGALPEAGRSEERRVGQECVRPCRSRWSPYYSKKK